MPSEKPRVMLTLDPETHEMLQQIATATDLSVAGIVSRLLGAHMHELAEFQDWLETIKNSRTRMFGKNLLQSYGPDTLIQGIRRIDPKYKLKSEQFEEAGRITSGKKK